MQAIRSQYAIVKKDFWQKCPATLQVKALDKEIAQAAVWFYSPEAEAYDFRHYATEGYSQSYYEGFDEVGATPFGIANTSSFSITAGKNVIRITSYNVCYTKLLRVRNDKERLHEK